MKEFQVVKQNYKTLYKLSKMVCCTVMLRRYLISWLGSTLQGHIWEPYFFLLESHENILISKTVKRNWLGDNK